MNARTAAGPISTRASAAPPKPLTAVGILCVALGALLGLALLKFGNPVILDHQVGVPPGVLEALPLTVSWPAGWGQGLVLLLSLAAAIVLGVSRNAPLPAFARRVWLWLPPLLWLVWQAVAASRTVDADLTALTLPHFAATVGCFALGLFVVSREGLPRLLLVFLLTGFVVCLVRGINQHQVEFKRDRQTLVDGEKSAWREFPTTVLEQMKQDGLIVHTNGMDIANPMILLKLQKGRIHGTLVYPNALAGAILLLFPVTLALAVFGTGSLRPPIRYLLLGLVAFLGLGCLFWTGSKSGWLIALGLVATRLLLSRIPRRLRLPLFAAVAILGLTAFGIRFRAYFSAGATSVGARFDYWRAAAATVASNPLTGTGPGTFQRPYSRLKSPEAEMARLVHNDYLEQFSDSGIPGGVLYLAWIGGLVVAVGRHAFQSREPMMQALALGVLAWFAQGFVEFGLYIPALAWTAFTLAGVLAALPVEREEPAG